MNEEDPSTAAGGERQGRLSWLGEPGHELHEDPTLVRAELRATERAFRALGLPTFERDFNAPDDIFGPAAPMLTVAFVAQCLLGLTRQGASPLFLLGGLLLGFCFAVAGVIIVNLVRRRAVFAIPERVGWPEMAVFVVVPPLLELFVGDGPFAATVMTLQQLAIVVLAWLLFGFGLLPVIVWTGRHFVRTLKRSGRILMKAVPLMIFFSFVLFFTQEIWEVYGGAAQWQVGLSTALFVGIASLFIAAHIPAGLARFIKADDPEMIPLDRRQTLNVEAIIFLTLALQVIFVTAVIFAFFVILGIVLMPETLAGQWLRHAVSETNPFGVDFNLNVELIRVSLGTALVSGLYYSVAMWLDEVYREDTLEQLQGDLGRAFRMRDRYLRLRSGIGGAETGAPDESAKAPSGDSVAAS